MPAQKKLSLAGSNTTNYLASLFDAEGSQVTVSPEDAERGPLDTELDGDPFDLTRRRLEQPSDVPRVDARGAVLHNAFFIPGKVPSLNELLDAKSKNQPRIASLIMRQKAKRGNRFDAYNELKQDWKRRTVAALGTPFVRVESCYFGYLIVEETLKRDPSNICSAAVKFIEDGLVATGAIPNDGWNNVLGIRVHWVHRKGREPGVYVVMSDRLLPEAKLVAEYEDHWMSVL